MNYAQLRRTAITRQATLEKELREAKSTVSAAEKELASLSQILGALKGVDGAKVTLGGKARTKRRKGGKLRPGHPGRPPKWYIEQQKGKGKGKAAKTPKAMKKVARKKRPASPKMLAALAKAREKLAAKRAAATAPPATA